MKFFLASAMLALAGLASAQQKCMAANEAIPACGAGYYRSAASAIGGCGLVDFKCQCSNSAAIQASIAASVAQQCGGDQIGQYISDVNTACECASKRPGNIKPNKVVKACSASTLAVPACAAGYFASAAYSLGCDLDDFACQCRSSASIQNAIAAPVASQCGGQINEVLQSQSAFCACVTARGKPVPAGPTTATSSASVSYFTASPSRFTSSQPKVTTGFHA